MATIYYAKNGKNGVTAPVKYECFIMYKGQYLARDGKFTTDKKQAVVAPSKSIAKQFVNKYKLNAKVVPLTQADYDELIVKPAEQAINTITTEGGDNNANL